MLPVVSMTNTRSRSRIANGVGSRLGAGFFSSFGEAWATARAWAEARRSCAAARVRSASLRAAWVALSFSRWSRSSSASAEVSFSLRDVALERRLAQVIGQQHEGDQDEGPENAREQVERRHAEELERAAHRAAHGRSLVEQPVDQIVDAVLAGLVERRLLVTLDEMLGENQYGGQRQGDERGVELDRQNLRELVQEGRVAGFAATKRSACEMPRTVPTKPSVGSTQMV